LKVLGFEFRVQGGWYSGLEFGILDLGYILVVVVFVPSAARFVSPRFVGWCNSPANALKVRVLGLGFRI